MILWRKKRLKDRLHRMSNQREQTTSSATHSTAKLIEKYGWQRRQAARQMHLLIPSFRHGEPYPRRAARGISFRVDAGNAGRERVARTASLLEAGNVNGGATAWFVHHGRFSGGWRPADLVRDREQAVLGRAFEVSGSTGGLVPRGLSRTQGLQRIRGDYANYVCVLIIPCVFEIVHALVTESNERGTTRDF